MVSAVECLRLTEVRIEQHTVRGNTSQLLCQFDLQGETLYSVKWYKDGNEFFRFLPRDSPPAQIFPLPGVAVDVSFSFTFSHMACKKKVLCTSTNQCWFCYGNIRNHKMFVEQVMSVVFMILLRCLKTCA